MTRNWKSSSKKYNSETVSATRSGNTPHVTEDKYLLEYPRSNALVPRQKKKKIQKERNFII